MIGAIVFLIWLCCSIICSVKQSQIYDKPHKTEDTSAIILASLFGPVWLLGAVIRQVFIEKWK